MLRWTYVLPVTSPDLLVALPAHIDLGDFSPDSLIEKALGQLGFSAVIIVLYQLINLIKSWIDQAKGIVERGRQAHALTLRAANRMRRMPKLQAALVGSVTVLVPAVQLLLVYFCFVIGNYFSILTVGQDRAARLSALASAEDFGAIEVWSPHSVLTRDWISEGYVLLAVIALALSYRNAQAGRRQTWTGILLALPVLAFVPLEILALILAVAATLMGGRDADTVTYTVAFGVAAILSMTFWAACASGVTASTVLTRAWDSNARPHP